MSDMTCLMRNMEIAMKVEYYNISDKYGKAFHTPHEAIGVLLEEIDEVNTEADVFNHCLAKCWDLIKQDKEPAEWFEAMKEAAIHAAAEWTQVAACCLKAQQKNDI